MALQLSERLRQQIANLRKDETIDDKTSMQARKVLVGLQQLRAANRELWQASKAAKLETAEAKMEVDKLNLNLQGVYYEQRQLKHEIKSCQEAPVIYDQIELIDEHDFLALFPEKQNFDTPHLMQARLEHEKEERLRLANVKKELASRKAALILENKNRKNELEALEKHLTRFVSSAGDIAKMFDKY